MIVLGVANVVSAILVAVCANIVPREVVFGIGGILHMGLMIGLLIWLPDQNNLLIFFIMSASWGVCDAVWQTQCNSRFNELNYNITICSFSSGTDNIKPCFLYANDPVLKMTMQSGKTFLFLFEKLYIKLHIKSHLKQKHTKASNCRIFIRLVDFHTRVKYILKVSS